jgi:hypothetical protein
MTTAKTLEGAAIVAVETLKQHPHLNTPEAMEASDTTPDQFRAPDYSIGLQEAASLDPPVVIRRGQHWVLASRY